MYSVESIHKRKALKNDPIVREAIYKFMELFTWGGSLKNKVCDKDEYIRMWTKIAEILYPREHDPEDLAKWVKQDFEKDSQTRAASPDKEEKPDEAEEEGMFEETPSKSKPSKAMEEIPTPIQYESISQEKLYLGLYELADNWTPNISNLEIRDFFKTIELSLRYPTSNSTGYLDHVDDVV